MPCLIRPEHDPPPLFTIPRLPQFPGPVTVHIPCGRPEPESKTETDGLLRQLLVLHLESDTRWIIWLVGVYTRYIQGLQPIGGPVALHDPVEPAAAGALQSALMARTLSIMMIRTVHPDANLPPGPAARGRGKAAPC